MSSPTPNGKRRAPASKAPAAGRGTSGRSGGTGGPGAPRPAAQGGRGGGSNGKGGKGGAKPPRTLKGTLLQILKWGVVTGLVLVVAGIVAFFIAYQKTSIPDPNKEFQTQTTYIYYAGGKSKIGQFADQNRESISYAEMPSCIKDAAVAAENRSFWTDKGIDPKGIIRAAFNNAQGGAKQGASTITQQYVKLLYLTQERTYSRKLKEAILSLKLQRTQSKQEILEGYLNTVYFGRGAYGIQAASHAYFDKPAAKLTVPQCAVLASVINNPSRFDPANGESSQAALLGRYRYVLSGMADDGKITDSEAAEAEAALPKFPKIKASSSKGGQKGHMLALVNSELRRLGFTDDQISGGGLRVTTTFDRKAMANAAEAVKEVAPKQAKDGKKITDKELHVGVASVEPGTGALRGFYGGQDFLQSEHNWAATGGMVGSTMKPFTLATALESGFSLKDTFDGNSPYTFPGSTLQVHNEGENSGQVNGHSYGSRITALFALEESVNTAFVDMSQAIPKSPRSIYTTAEKMGIPPAKAEQDYPGIPSTSPDFDPKDTLLTLGKANVSPINMANAYATLANRGKRADVHVITKVVDRKGTVRYQYKNHTERAIDEDVADDVSYAAQQVVKSGTGRSALALGRPAAGKTGTATKEDGKGGSYVSSSWFVGYTPQLATAVMYVRGDGNDRLDGWMPSYFGADYPTRTWTAVMSRDLEGKDREEFPPPAWVDGDAPTNGHQPVPTKAPSKPKPTKTKTSKPKPSSSAPPPPPATSSAPPSTTPPSTQPPSNPVPPSNTATPSNTAPPVPRTGGPTGRPTDPGKLD